VRRRRTAERGGPAESVTARKRGRVVRAARRWLVENPRFARREIRFDVVAIQDEPFSLDWIRGAFDAV
jgi:putative endonuclease